MPGEPVLGSEVVADGIVVGIFLLGVFLLVPVRAVGVEVVIADAELEPFPRLVACAESCGEARPVLGTILQVQAHVPFLRDGLLYSDLRPDADLVVLLCPNH